MLEQVWDLGDTIIATKSQYKEINAPKNYLCSLYMLSGINGQSKEYLAKIVLSTQSKVLVNL